MNFKVKFNFRKFPLILFYILILKFEFFIMSNNITDDGELTINTNEEEDNIYEVESILSKKKQGNKWLYKVKWEGWSINDCTWEPLENLSSVDEILKEFEEKWEKENPNSKLNKSVSTTNEPKTGRKGKTNSENVSAIKSPVKPSKSNEVKKPKGRPLKSVLQPAEENLPQLKRKRKIEDEKQNQQKSSKTDSPSNVVETVQIEEEIKAPIKTLPKISETSFNSNSSQDPIIIADEEYNPKVYGCFENNDIPLRLLTARQSGFYNEVNCLVDWQIRQNGIKPSNSFVPIQILRVRCPNLLLDFYESRLRFPVKHMAA